MTRALGCLAAALLAAGPARAADVKVLFVGNSYTYVNEMPAMFAAVARSLGDDVETEMAAPGGATLEGHASSPATLEKIRSRPWTFVVLQEQSQRPDFPENQLEKEVYPFALKLGAAVRAAGGAKTVFFETWGHKDGDRMNCANLPGTCGYEGMQSRISNAYAAMAERTPGLLAPVGTAWRNVRRAHPEIGLYADDGIHPSLAGSYLAACVFYSLLFRRGAVGADRLGLDGARANVLQRAAQDAVFHRDGRAAPKIK